MVVSCYFLLICLQIAIACILDIRNARISSKQTLGFDGATSRGYHGIFTHNQDVSKEHVSNTQATFEEPTNEPRSEKTGLRGFRPGPTQTGLYSHRRWLEA